MPRRVGKYFSAAGVFAGNGVPLPKAIRTAIDQVTPWISSHGIKIVAILLTALFVRRFASALLAKLIRRMVTVDNVLTAEEETRREETLVRIFTTSLGVVVWTIGILMGLQAVGVDIAPLLAAAGIAGVALGLAGQHLIRDLISGLFIIMENQYRIGDRICCDNTCGVVEDMTMRMTTLRDLDGVVHHIPHGEIKRISNQSKRFSRVNLNIGVAYHANIEQVIDVVNRVGRELAEDPAWCAAIVKPPQFLRIEDFGETAMIIKILGETQPLKQPEVTGELRKRLKIAFDHNGIEMSSSHRPLTQKTSMPPPKHY